MALTMSQVREKYARKNENEEFMGGYRTGRATDMTYEHMVKPTIQGQEKQPDGTFKETVKVLSSPQDITHTIKMLEDGDFTDGSMSTRAVGQLLNCAKNYLQRGADANGNGTLFHGVLGAAYILSLIYGKVLPQRAKRVLQGLEGRIRVIVEKDIKNAKIPIARALMNTLAHYEEKSRIHRQNTEII